MSYTEYISCPFCHDTDFDLIGLKLHLERGHCDVFNTLGCGCREDYTDGTKYCQRCGLERNISI